MAEPAMNDWLMKSTVQFVGMYMVSKFSNIMNCHSPKTSGIFAALVVQEVKTIRACYNY